MKKIICLLSLFLFLNASLANAEIRKGTDEFSGKIFFESKSYNIPTGAISLKKIGNNYKIIFWKPSISGEKFTRENIPIKIDDNDVEFLTVEENIFNQITKNIMDISIKSKVSQDVINKIKVANRVALKFYKDKGEPVIIVLPDEVLAEWKQVIEVEGN